VVLVSANIQPTVSVGAFFCVDQFSIPTTFFLVSLDFPCCQDQKDNSNCLTFLLSGMRGITAVEGGYGIPGRSLVSVQSDTILDRSRLDRNSLEGGDAGPQYL